MNKTDANLLCNAFCNPEMLKDLEKTRVMEIAPDIWEVEGYAGTIFILFTTIIKLISILILKES